MGFVLSINQHNAVELPLASHAFFVASVFRLGFLMRVVVVVLEDLRQDSTTTASWLTVPFLVNVADV